MSDDPGIMTRSMEEPDIYACISAMLVQEHQYLCHDYLNLSNRQPAHHNMTYGRCDPIDETCRSKMSEWCFHVVDCTNLRRETVSIAMGYLDRFLCTTSIRAEQARCDRKEYQLAAMTALYVAVKIFEPLEMDAGLVSKLSRGLHSAAEITRLEHEMLVALNWRMNCPSPYQICNFLLELLPETAQDVKPTLYDYCHFQTELATGDYAYVPLRRSVIAVASVLNALEGISQQDLLIPDRVKFINSISRAVDYDICSPVVNAVRIRLLESFAKSSGFALPQAGLIPAVESKPEECDDMFIGDETCLNIGKLEEFGESPVCISREMAITLGTDMHSTWDQEHHSI